MGLKTQNTSNTLLHGTFLPTNIITDLNVLLFVKQIPVTGYIWGYSTKAYEITIFMMHDCMLSQPDVIWNNCPAMPRHARLHLLLDHRQPYCLKSLKLQLNLFFDIRKNSLAKRRHIMVTVSLWFADMQMVCDDLLRGAGISRTLKYLKCIAAIHKRQGSRWIYPLRCSDGECTSAYDQLRSWSLSKNG